MGRKVLIRDNELVYFSEKQHDFICIRKDIPNYVEILEYVLNHQNDFSEEEFIFLTKKFGTDVSAYSNGKVKTENNAVKITITSTDCEKKINEFEMPQSLINAIKELRDQGYSFEHFENFWKKCMNNPNPMSVMRLFDFLKAEKLQIFKDGCFMAYKSVNFDYKDYYTSTIDNHPGQVVSIPREEVEYNPKEGCSFGLHCGAYSYASQYGDEKRIIVCVKVDPADVVSVPEDCSFQKIRVCKYVVMKEMEKENIPPQKTVIISEELKKEEPENKSAEKNESGIRLTKPYEKYEDDFILRARGANGHIPEEGKNTYRIWTWGEIGKKLHRSGESCRKRYYRLSRFTIIK